MSNLVPITVAEGDGIGPEIMAATMKILEAAGARIAPEHVTIGEKKFLSGFNNGIGDETWESIARTKVFLKAPITTPQGGGYKSVNVTLRKSLGLFANVRPVKTYQPYVGSKHKEIDMVIVRENEEDLYSGVEYRQTRDTCHSVKLLSRSGSELIIRYAFEYARAHGRKKVTCLIKDNIMKISDGLFHKVFKLIAADYPEIEADSIIVDIGMALVADRPEDFDVLVTLNLYGDIVSDIASQIAGSVGLAGSFKMGQQCAMFEAVHGSAPDIAGQGIANPSGLLNSAILMLHHIGQSDIAAKVENAWLCALEDGAHTGDIAKDKSKALSTSEFADAVIERFGREPKELTLVETSEKSFVMPTHDLRTISKRHKELVGVDVYLDWRGQDAEEIGGKVESSSTDVMKFSAMSSRGVKVYPGKCETELVSDLWRCRFRATGGSVKNADVNVLLSQLEKAGLEWVKVENLYTFDDEDGFTVLQGE